MRRVPARVASRLYGAAELIAERGLDGAKIDEIADAAGIPKATLYYHFAGKDEILAFLLADMLELMASEVAVAAASPETSASDRLGKVFHAQLAVMLENPAVCRALVGELGRATRLPELAAALTTAFQEPVERLLTEGVGDGSFHGPIDVAAVATSMFGAVTVAGLQAAVANPDTDVTALAHEIRDTFVDGIGSTS